MIKLETPLTIEKVESLRAGDQVLLSGTIYTGRDAAHKRFVEALKNNEPLPFDPYDQVIYFVGPTPTKPGHIIGLWTYNVLSYGCLFSCHVSTGIKRDDW